MYYVDPLNKIVLLQVSRASFRINRENSSHGSSHKNIVRFVMSVFVGSIC